MQLDLAMTLGANLLCLIVYALIVRFVLRQAVAFRWVAAGIGAIALYSAATVYGYAFQAYVPLLAGVNWNWTGKLCGLAITLAMMAVVPGASAAEMGMTLRQRPGSIGPAIACIALLCLFSWGLEALADDGSDVSTARLLFQGIVPGLDEEPFFRGLLLALWLRAFGDERRIAGAVIGPGAIGVTLFFALAHATSFRDMVPGFSWIGFGITGTIGFGLLWIRQRTGSVALPVVAHNVVNFGNSFF